jgi:hypothetical protein
MTRHIQASHLITELDSELRNAEANRLDAIERRRHPQPDPQAAKKPKPTPLLPTPGPAPKPVPKAAPKQLPAPAPRKQPPSEPSLPPGSVILSPEEAQAVDHLLASHPQTRHLFKKGQR